MGKGLFIVGTDTDVGKTLISSIIVKNLKDSGVKVAYYKPVVSGGTCDMDFVKAFVGLKEDISYMNSYTMEKPLSPHLASNIENITIESSIINKKFKSLMEENEVVVCEGAGGIKVPLNYDGLLIGDLVKDFNIPVIIVARAGLGTINHTLITIESLKRSNINIKGIVINGYEEANICHIDNKNTIKNLIDEEILAVVPKVKDTNDLKNFKILGGLI